MPVAMDWETPERKIIRVTFMGEWDVDDIHRMITKRNSMMDCVNHPVHMILDMTASTSSPSNLLSVISRIELPANKTGSLVIQSSLGRSTSTTSELADSRTVFPATTTATEPSMPLIMRCGERAARCRTKSIRQARSTRPTIPHGGHASAIRLAAAAHLAPVVFLSRQA